MDTNVVCVMAPHRLPRVHAAWVRSTALAGVLSLLLGGLHTAEAQRSASAGEIPASLRPSGLLPPRPAAPRAFVAGDAAADARGLGGPTRSGIAVMLPVALVFGHFTPYLSFGAVGERWRPDSTITSPTDSIRPLPVTYRRRSLDEELTDSTARPFIGAGVGVKAGALGVSGEVRKVHGKGTQSQVRGKLKF